MLDNPATMPTNWEAVADPVVVDQSRYAGDNRLLVQFYRKPVRMEGESQKAGRAIYRDLDFIKILVPGDKLTIIDRKVNEIDEQRFADRYAKWKSGAGNVIEGTPLASLPKMNPSKVEEYKFFNIHTVEQLAEAGPRRGLGDGGGVCVGAAQGGR